MGSMANLKSGRKLIVTAALAAMLTVAGGACAFAASDVAPAAKATPKKAEMHTYVIERTIPGAGNLSKKDLHDISAKSNGILKDMGPDIKWVDSFVTGDKVYCIYKAKNEDLIREHAKRGGFPADRVSEVTTMISPATGR